jgi:hypothetical protein
MMLAPLAVLEVALLMSTDWTPVLVGAGAVLSAFALVLPTIVAVWSHNVQSKKLDNITTATNGALAAVQSKADRSAGQVLELQSAAGRREAEQPHD